MLIVLNVTVLGQCNPIGNPNLQKVPDAVGAGAPAAGGYPQPFSLAAVIHL